MLSSLIIDLKSNAYEIWHSKNFIHKKKERKDGDKNIIFTEEYTYK